MSTVAYLYGFVPAETAPPPATLTGVGEAEVELLDAGGFHAVVSLLPEREYGGERLQARLKDLGWVGEQGIRHESVVTWFVDRTAIVPARLFTVFSSPAVLAQEAGARRAAIETGLERFRHAHEWDLKVAYDHEEVSAHLGELSDEAAELDRRILEAAPGRRYLLERKREELARREARRVAVQLARSLLGEVGRIAEDVVELEIPAARQDLPVVSSAALLVSDERAEELRQLVAESSETLEPRGVRATLTGPWAPYRFVAEDTHD
jgi:hypothetical protein